MATAFASALPLAARTRAAAASTTRRRVTIAACAAAPSPRVQNATTVRVNRETGKRTKKKDGDSALVTSGAVDLPLGLIKELDVTTERAAQAAVFGLAASLATDSTTWLADARVVVFAHGFSQRGANYASTLRALALQGFVVLAPRVWLLDVAWPWVTVETAPTGLFDTAGKLQTALLIDIARSTQLARGCGAAELHVLGHSMGGAMALAYLPYTPPGALRSAAVLAPAVADAPQTQLNPYVFGDDPANFARLAHAMPSTPLLLLQGARDRIVDAGVTELLADVLQRRAAALTGLGVMERGTHVGFEDRLNVDVDVPVLDVVLALVFLVIDLLVFGPGDVLDLDTSEQLQSTKSLLDAWFAAAGNVPDAVVVDRVDSAPVVVDDVELSWSTEPVPVKST